MVGSVGNDSKGLLRTLIDLPWPPSPLIQGGLFVTDIIIDAASEIETAMESFSARQVLELAWASGASATREVMSLIFGDKYVAKDRQSQRRTEVVQVRGDPAVWRHARCFSIPCKRRGNLMRVRSNIC